MFLPTSHYNKRG